MVLKLFKKIVKIPNLPLKKIYNLINTYKSKYIYKNIFVLP